MSGLERKQLYLKREPIWIAFTADKKPFQLTRGRTGWEYHTQAEAIRHIELYRSQGKPLYLGIQLWRRLGLVCIDIDRPFTTEEAHCYVNRLCQRLDLYEVYVEFSLNGNLHIFFRAEELPEQTSRAVIELLGERAEIYWHHQAILLTQNRLPFSTHDLEQVSIADTQALAKLLPSDPQPAPLPSTSTQPAQLQTARPAPKPTDSLTHRNTRNRPQRLFLEIIHLFPSFYKPLLQPFLAYPAHSNETRLRRPGKNHSHSATLFLDTGIVYNFSTNWTNVPPASPQRLANFLCQAYQWTPRQLGQQFHRYLQRTSQQLQLPIPRRKNRCYYTLHRSLYHLFLLWQLLLDTPRTLKELQHALSHQLRYTPHRTTLQRGLQQLLTLGLVQRTRTRHGYQYTITPVSRTIAQKLQTLELGWQFITFHHILHLCTEQQLQQINTTTPITIIYQTINLIKKLQTTRNAIFNQCFQPNPPSPPQAPPYLFLSNGLHTFLLFSPDPEDWDPPPDP